MPARHWVPLAGPMVAVQAEHLHGAISRLLDCSTAEHKSAKPYACSPVIEGASGPGFVLSSLTREMAHRLQGAFAAQPVLKLGDRRVVAGPAALVGEQSWTELACSTPRRVWKVELLSPTMRRRNGRVSALPEPYSLCAGLLDRWNRWAGEDYSHPIPPDRFREILVTDLALRSHSGSWGSIPDRLTGGDYVLTGSHGFMDWLLPDPDLAAAVSPLLRLANYAGLGSYTGRGFGFCRVAPIDRNQRGTPG